MGSNPVGITSKAPFSRRFFYCTPPLRHTNIIILDKYNDKLRLYNNLIHLKSFLPILLEKHYRPATGNSICSTHPCNYRNWSILKKNRIRLSKRRSQRKQRTFTYHGSAGRGKRNSNKFGPVLSSHHLCRRQDAPGNFWKQTFIITSAFSYICCNQVGFIWLSTDWIKLARERAMDKKKPDCSEPPYFSCFQITLYLTCKDNISFWKGHINGCNLTE